VESESLFALRARCLIKFSNMQFLKTYKELSKFAIVGGLSTGVNYSIFFVCYTFFGVYYVLASIINQNKVVLTA